MDMHDIAHGVKHRLIHAIKRLYPRWGLRSSDIILASYPKSGNTWVRFIWANIVSLEELGGRAIDFHYLNNELVAEYDTHAYGSVEYNCLPRLVKTHQSYEPRIFGENQCVYLYRHPGDVAVSYYAYLSAKKSNPLHGMSFSEFIRDDAFGIPAWCRHVQAWHSSADAVIRYKDLKNDARKVILNTLADLDTRAVEKEVVAEAVRRSSFTKVRRIEEEIGLSTGTDEEFKEGFRFTRKGQKDEWKEAMGDEDRAFMQQELKGWGLTRIQVGHSPK